MQKKCAYQPGITYLSSTQNSSRGGILALMMLGLLVSCKVPTPLPMARARIEIAPRGANLRTNPNQSLNLANSILQPPPFAPLDASSFNCLFINVMGPDIGDWSSNSKSVTDNVGTSYFSLYSQVIDLKVGGTVDLVVPKGSQRIFQAIGVASTKSCPSTLTKDDFADTGTYLGMFEIGRSKVDLSQDVNIEIKNTYNPLTTRDVRNYLGKKSKDIDSESPVISGDIQAVRSGRGIKLTWPAAKDNGTVPQYLLYKVVSADFVEALDTIENADAEKATADWALGVTSYSANPVDAYKVYTVLVKDAAGNISQYDPIEVFGFPELSYSGVDGALSFGVAVALHPSNLEDNGSAITGCAVKAGTTALPSWASIDTKTCVISGTPDQPLVTTTYTIIAKNSVGDSSAATISLGIAGGAPVLSYAESTGRTGSVGSAFSVSPSNLATNGLAITNCTIKTGTTALPSWASVGRTTCVISGTPDAVLSSTTYTIVASNAAGNSNSARVTISVNAAAPVLSYASSTGTSGVVATPMSVSPSTLASNGASITACGIKGGTTALPGWASVNATTCVISGTPNATLSTRSYTLVATNSVGNSADATVTLTVAAGVPTLSYSGATGTNGTHSVAMSVSPTTLNANGSSITGCAIKGGTTALPGWASVNATTCVISGIPNATLSSTTYTLVATNSAGNSADATVTLSVAAGVPSLSYSGATGTNGTYNVAMSVSPTTLNTNGASITACAIKGGTTALPGWASVNATTCVISGTPNATLSSTTYTLVATNSAGNSSDATVTLSVVAVVPTLSYSGATGTNGTYNVAMSVSPTTLLGNGASITACGIKSGTTALPGWASVNATTCVISGTPNAALSSTSYTLVATNSAGRSADATVTLSVAGAAPTLSYAGATGTTGSTGSAMSISPTTLSSNGASITGCAIKGGTTALPAGLSVNSTTCVISGTPSVTVSATTYTIIATNSIGDSADATVTLTITGCDSSLFSGGSGISGDPFQVANKNDLLNVPQCTSSGNYLIQTADIDLGGSGSPWTPIILKGKYDGNNHQITGLYIRSTTVGNDAGLFSTVYSGASISNLTISSVDVQGAGMTGALAGTSSGTITNCFSSGSVGFNFNSSSAYFAGGLVGQMSAGSVSSSHSSATLTVTIPSSTSFNGGLGGLVGKMGSGTTLTSSYATGNITATPSLIGAALGGLVGYVISATITSSYSTGNITFSGNGTAEAGMIGFASSPTISQCFAKGTYAVTGFIRYAYVGGIIGYMSGGSVNNSYAMVTTTVTSGYPVNGGASGGLIGNPAGSVTISNTYSASPSMGSVSAGTVHGFSGVTLSSGLSNSYLYANGSVASDTSTGLTSYSTSGAMQTQSNFSGFDFSTTWVMPDANTMSGGLLSPVLIWQCGANGISCGGALKVKKIFISKLKFSGQMGGIQGADALCANDENKPDFMVYKALLVDGSNRIACTSPHCIKSKKEHLNWVLSPNTLYVRPDNTSIGITNSNKIFSFSLNNELSKDNLEVWTGLKSDWTPASSENCANWNVSSSGKGVVGYADNSSSGSIDSASQLCDTKNNLYCVEQ